MATFVFYFCYLEHSSKHEGGVENCVLSSNCTSGGQQAGYKIPAWFQRAEWHGNSIVFRCIVRSIHYSIFLSRKLRRMFRARAVVSSFYPMNVTYSVHWQPWIIQYSVTLTRLINMSSSFRIDLQFNAWKYCWERRSSRGTQDNRDQ